MSMTNYCLKYTLLAWQNVGTSTRMTIQEELTRIFLKEVKCSDEKKIKLMARAIGRMGWHLNTLSKKGYGYNSAGDKHIEDNAGKLNEFNKRGVWVLH